MLTVGVDLAAAEARTALAEIEWSPEGGRVREVIVGVGDDRIVEAFGRAEKVGVDCPVGWPQPFVDLVAGNARPPADTGPEWRRTLAWRTTDRIVHRTTGILPLSVSADRIAHVAFRCAGILARLEDQPLDGSATLAEVYPAAALWHWGLPYKQKAANLSKIVDGLTGLDLGPHEHLMKTNHDATDAVVAALVARAAAIGCGTRPPADLEAVVKSEGWIVMPTCQLDELP